MQSESTVGIAGKAKAGVRWVILATALGQALSFIISVVLARILFPRDFGTVGIAMIFTEIPYVIGNLGIGAALVQKRTISTVDKHVAFTACIIVGAAETVLLLALSPMVGRLFSNALAGTVMAYLSLQILLTAAGITPAALLQRQLRFKELAVLQMTYGLVHGGSAILLAVRGFGVWSLVWPPLIASAARVIVAHWLARYFPIPIFRWGVLGALLRFGSLLTLKNALVHLRRKADCLLVGKFLGTVPLGLYSRSLTLVSTPQSALHRVVHTVSFPSFSLVQSDLSLLRTWYLQAASLVALVIVPALLGFCAVADDFVVVLFTAKWAGMITPVRIICVAGILTAIASLATTALEATDNVRFEIWVELLCGLAVAGGGLVALRWGIAGVASAILAAAGLSFVGRGYLLHTRLGLPFREYLSVLWLPLACASVMVGAISALHHVGFAAPTRLLLSIISGALVYTLLIAVTGQRQYGFLMSELGSLWMRWRKPRRLVANGRAGGW